MAHAHSLGDKYNVSLADFICRYCIDRKSSGSFRYLQFCKIHYIADPTHKPHTFYRIGKTRKCQVLLFWSGQKEKWQTIDQKHSHAQYKALKRAWVRAPTGLSIPNAHERIFWPTNHQRPVFQSWRSTFPQKTISSSGAPATHHWRDSSVARHFCADWVPAWKPTSRKGSIASKSHLPILSRPAADFTTSNVLWYLEKPVSAHRTRFQRRWCRGIAPLRPDRHTSEVNFFFKAFNSKRLRQAWVIE